MDQSSTQIPKRSIKDLPKRPQRTNNFKNIGHDIKLVYQLSFIFQIQQISNHYPINLASLFKTASDSQGQPFPHDDRKGRSQIYQKIAGKLKEWLGKYYESGWTLWGFKDIKETQRLVTEHRGRELVVEIKLVSALTFNDLLTKDDLNLQFRQVLNVIVKQYLKELGYADIGKNLKYYKKEDRDKNIVNKTLKVWHGYKTSTHVFNKVPMLLIDFSSRVLRNESALERMYQLEDQKYQKPEIEEYFKECSVIAPYGTQKIYRIHEVDFKSTPDSKFKLEDGTEKTFRQYYKERYNLDIKTKNQPLLVHNQKKWVNKLDGTKEKIVEQIKLVPELVNMTGITDQEKADFRLMQDLAKYTKLEPTDRMDVITNLKKPLQKLFDKDGIKLENLTNLIGILLNPPKILLQLKKSMTTKDGNFMLRDPVRNPIELKDWIMVYNSKGQRDDDEVDEFIDFVIKSAATFGIKVSKPYYVVMNNFLPDKWCTEIQKEVAKAKPQVILTWFPDNQKGKLYKELKRLCYKDMGIPHQNVLSTKFFKCKNKMSVASKIIMQINAKLGFPLWVVEPVEKISKKTMVIGVDVYHKTIKGKNSCAGFVASLDAEFSKYYSSTVIQGIGQELMLGIASHVHQALLEYLKINKSLPDTIIIYRDGVGESQVDQLLNVEVNQIKKYFAQIDPNYKPQFAVILINKRINHRFFNDKGNSESNPISGTLVCDTVVQDSFEFFLVPQNVTQGTATPTMYKVIENSTNLPEETFYQFTFFQCFNYANWTGAVRVPACAQYAHKLAYLVGDTFQAQIHKELVKTLCFL